MRIGNKQEKQVKEASTCTEPAVVLPVRTRAAASCLNANTLLALPPPLIHGVGGGRLHSSPWKRVAPRHKQMLQVQQTPSTALLGN